MTDKHTFKTRTIRLVGPVQRDAALALIPNLPLDPDQPLELVIREEKKARGLDANGYYWMRLGEIAEQAWLGGRQFDKDVWHEYGKKNLMPEMVVTKDGDVRSKWIESPDGSPVVISTAQLDRKTFAQYTEAVEAFGATIGVMFSEIPRGRNA